jgi:hypothetical protein
MPTAYPAQIAPDWFVVTREQGEDRIARGPPEIPRPAGQSTGLRDDASGDDPQFSACRRKDRRLVSSSCGAIRENRDQ